jgi:hypothetical protein
MGANTQGYVPASGKWKAVRNAVGEVGRSTRSKESHAERVAYAALPDESDVYLLVQDAFPCFDHCHQFFARQSEKNRNIIIKVTKDGTFDGPSYVKEGLLPNLTRYPCYIFYFRGNATASAGNPAPPNGFPGHPDLAGV